MPDEIMRANQWGTNAAMIAEAVVPLGYLDGAVLDATYGEGKFWSKWQPEMLTASDLHKDPSMTAEIVGAELYESYQWSYLALPCADGEYDSVVFDPPYRLGGTPGRPDDYAYGNTRTRSREAVLDDIVAGAVECFRVCSRFVLIKCMDAVEGGKVRWQTDLVTRAVEAGGGVKVDRFDFVKPSRPQPPGRAQYRTRSNYSTLLVFAKPGRHRG